MNCNLNYVSVERAIKTSLLEQITQANFQTNPEIFWNAKE